MYYLLRTEGQARAHKHGVLKCFWDIACRATNRSIRIQLERHNPSCCTACAGEYCIKAANHRGKRQQATTEWKQCLGPQMEAAAGINLPVPSLHRCTLHRTHMSSSVGRNNSEQGAITFFVCNGRKQEVAFTPLYVHNRREQCIRLGTGRQRAVHATL